MINHRYFIALVINGVGEDDLQHPGKSCLPATWAHPLRCGLRAENHDADREARSCPQPSAPKQALPRGRVVSGSPGVSGVRQPEFQWVTLSPPTLFTGAS